MIVSCEHGGNRLPARYRIFLDLVQETLDSHRGYDLGAAHLAREISKACGSTRHIGTETRLLVDLNRSLDNAELFSDTSKNLSDRERAKIISDFYQPFRQAVEEDVARQIRRNPPLLHLSVHTFTPILEGAVRKCDIGLLYDPAREIEKDFCREWQALLKERYPQFLVRFNYPYQGVSDGFTTHLRKRYSGKEYCGIELEVNQRLAAGSADKRHEVAKALCNTLRIMVLR